MGAFPPVRIRDLLPGYRAYERAAAGLPEHRWPELWERRYRQADPAVFDVVRRQGGLRDGAELTDALRRLRALGPELPRRAAAVRALLPGVFAEVGAALGWPGDGEPPECVLLVGLFGASGWAEVLGTDRYALFLAVEQLGEPPYDRVLVAHEAAHLVHDRLAGIHRWPEHAVGAALLTEGLATQVSVEAEPRLSLAEHLWTGPAHRAWLTECAAAWPRILERIDADLDTDDPRRHAAYFRLRDRPDRGDLPARVGYLVGLHLVRHLRRVHPLGRIARWDLPRASTELRRALADLRAAGPEPPGPD